MAPSLRDLIDFLLAEIALCGDQGASPSDILTFINSFYSKSTQDASTRNHTTDRPFQEKVWLWLTRNPEVSVGKEREGNHLTLDDAERQADGEEAIRVFVSKERTWLAITGHEPDEAKVFPTEFALLSIIASRKSNGIVQTELVRLSGQDKRSVPKRTDMLQKKGYIEKRAIQIKSARTSLCTLRKFLKPEYLATETPVDQETGAINQEKVIDFKEFTDKLFGILQEHKLISRKDLKDLLGFADSWRWRILSRALRKFERIGVLKRVKAVSQYAEMKKMYPCVMLTRDPSQRDYELFQEYSRNITADLEQEDTAEMDEGPEPFNITRDPSALGNVEAVRMVKQEEDVEEPGRTIPIWTPDRNLHNLIFDAIDRAGTSGSTNFDIIGAGFGSFFRRPGENALARLVECWQLSQPLHLRHLAIVRDTALEKTITHYVHYSATNFQKLVDTGEATWEAVEFVPRHGKADNMRIPPMDAAPQLDEFGLPLATPAKELLKNGNASLAECMLVVNPANYTCSGTDPAAVQLNDGTYTIRYGHQKLAAGARQLGRPKATPNKIKEEIEDISEMDMDETIEEHELAPKRPKKSKFDNKRFKGMSDKEKFEALGMDETWTEYNVLLIDRSAPGIYLTPRGRRRPAGKRQGRPRISRIAVFKLPKLNSLPWFVEEMTAEEDGAEEAVDSIHLESQARNTEETPVVSLVSVPASPSMPPEVTPSRGTKRSFQRASPSVESEARTRGKSKQRRLDETSQDSQDVAMAIAQSPENVTTNGVRTAEHSPDKPLSTLSNRRPKRKRAKSPTIKEQEVLETDGHVQEGGNGSAHALTMADSSELNVSSQRENIETPSKKPRHEPRNLRGEKGTSITPVVAETEGTRELLPDVVESDSTALATTERPLENIPSDDITPLEDVSAITGGLDLKPDQDEAVNSVTLLPSGEAQEVEIVPNAPQTPDELRKRVKRFKMEKGGSVAVLRRTIVIDIVEKAGGAFPMGTEIWYPFTTAWMKTKYKEKPDLRTIKTSIKHLIDAGKLRQMTFSGRDSKGIMVTKSIIAKPDLPPDDPFIKNMQHQMLTTEARYYFPPNIEMDPTITKSGGSKAFPNRDAKPGQLPVQPGVSVQLHHKPALVLAQEKKKGLSIQRRLLKRLEMEQENQRVVRLMRIQRAPAPGTSTSNLTSISRPAKGGDGGKKRAQRRQQAATDALTGPISSGGTRRMKRLWTLSSSMAPYAMLMNPRQTFHPVTGTFATNAGLAAVRRRSTATVDQRKQIPISSIAPYAMFMNPRQTFNAITGTFATDAGSAARRGRAGLARRRTLIDRWQPDLPDQPDLPQSLDELLHKTRRRTMDYSGKVDPRSSQFFSDTNVLLRWELRNEEQLLRRKSADFRYFNQTVQDSFETAPIDGNIEFNIEEIGQPVSPQEQRKTSRRAGRRYRYILPDDHGPPEPEELEELEELEEAEMLAAPLDLMTYYTPRRQGVELVPQSRRLEKLNEVMAADEGDMMTSAQSSSHRQQPIRRNRAAQQLPYVVVQKIMTAIVVVRALAGGLDGRTVDWTLVASSFPDQDPKLITERGKSILSRNRLQVAKMQSDFQERFIEAYANGQVPPINYNDLEGYDWGNIVNWAFTQLDVPKSEKLPDLPATREQFDCVFELREEAPISLEDVYQTTHGMTINRKRALFAGTVFAMPLPNKSARSRLRQAELSRLDVVKTWVRANVIAPEETYRASDARQALEYMGNNMIDNALQSLVTERVISMGNRGRITPGRNYDITDHFLHTLGRKRTIETTHLRRAARFKTRILDPEFQSRGSFAINYHAEDGDILALINLAAERRIILKPRDPPRDKYGLTDGGYLTRLIDKDKLRFVVEAHPAEGSYVYGNPIQETMSTTPPLPPPSVVINSTTSVPEKIPLWYDIHGNFVKVLWDLAVTAVVGTAATRPGISAAEIASMIKPTMGPWEVQLLLEWMEKVGVTRFVGGNVGDEQPGWYVQEWWWMILA